MPYEIVIDLIAAHFLSQMSAHYLAPHAWRRSLAPAARIRSWCSSQEIDLNWDYTWWRQALNASQKSKPEPVWSAFRQQTCIQIEELALEIVQHMAFLKRCRGTYLTIANSNYPDSLRAISDPPLGISILGEPAVLAKPMVSVIGSRQATSAALQVAEEAGYCLARTGRTVVSGGALGCDSAAHWGALQAMTEGATGSTVVVFASGLAEPAPRRNLGLYEQILAKGGAWISERIFHQISQNYHFPIRNRIISGLSPNIAIVQATLTSGSYKTACTALGQGREIHVMANEIADNVMYSGNQRLLAEGAQGFGRGFEFANQCSR